MVLPYSTFFDRMETTLKGRMFLGSPILDKNNQVSYLKQRLNLFLETLDAIDPEDTDLEDIDRLIEMVDDLDAKCQELNTVKVSQFYWLFFSFPYPQLPFALKFMILLV